MKHPRHIAQQTVLPFANGNRVVEVPDDELPKALDRLRAEHYHPAVLERIGNARWRVEAWPLSATQDTPHGH